MAGISLFLFKQGSRNAYNNDRKEKQFLDNYQKLFHMTLPHLDTADAYFRDLPDDALEQVKAGMISPLIRNKVIESGKFCGYYVVAIDGTGVATFNNKHCESCLSKTSKNGVTTYHHNVLEAKLLTPSGLSLSIATEWISNEGKNEYQKQDCEREAFKRLAKKLKKLYPRLPILITVDGLYPWDGFFTICQQNRWKYIVVLKDGNLTSLQEDISFEKTITPKQITEVKRADKIQMTTLKYHWLNGLPYRKHLLNYVECVETCVNVKSQETTTHRFVHLTNLEVDGTNCDGVSFTGRLRQKIENEGFNSQKNQGYALEHKFSRISFQALKNYYQCLQIAHIINQLTEASQTIKALLKKTLKCTVKYLWKRLLSFLLENQIVEYEMEALVSKPFQIRLT